MASLLAAVDVENWVELGSAYHVTIGDYTLYTCPDKSAAESIARKLDAVRHSSYHNAMNILTQELYLAEETAKLVYHLMFEVESTIGVNVNAKPN